MITHYGLFWSERDVFWGRPGRGIAGALLGREATQIGRRGAPTKTERDNARDYCNFRGLYCLYNDGDLIYVGEAGLGTQQSLLARLRRHRTGPLADRWDRFSWFGREDCQGETDIRSALGQLEAIAIAVINPGFNKQSGTFVGATQVFQVPHEEAEGDLETKIVRMAGEIEKLLSKQASTSATIDRREGRRRKSRS